MRHELLGPTMTVQVTRLPVRLTPDPRRVITRSFLPGDRKRVRDIIERVLALSEVEVAEMFQGLQQGFREKHPNLEEVFSEHFQLVRGELPIQAKLTRTRELVLGACFTMEYALEAVALFNPSMVPAIHQEGLPTGSVRFLMSLRATGEGHISSIVFRAGSIDAGGNVSLDPPGAYTQPLKPSVPDRFDKATFRRDLAAATSDPHCAHILDLLPDKFTLDDLSGAIDVVRKDQRTSGFLEETADTLISLTRVNYHLPMPGVESLQEAEIVVFPFSDIERNGIEDLRLVRFTGDDGSHRYYGTFTAYNGVRIFPQLVEFGASDKIDISLITGECAKNKGMALFPKCIGGRYAMLSRIDNENLFYMESDDVRNWDHARMIQRPKFPWQLIQIGNCGSPIETDRGWLVLTHGVGPMRQYSIGATLLDADEPWRVVAQTREPLLMPTPEERSGYVPNVVYSCGAMLHNGMLFIPYAMSDISTSMARVDLDELLASMTSET